MLKDLLLPGSDSTVALQLAATLIAGPVSVVILARYGKPDIAWLLGGVLALWLAFTAFRSLH